MQKQLLLIMLCGHLTVMSQVTFTQCPADLQLYGRDLSTNTATVHIDGFAKTFPVQYDSLLISASRNNLVYNEIYLPLIYVNDTAFFTSSHTITAELANYSFEVSGFQNGVATEIREVVDVVAGDAFIISGQSNAEAKQRNESTAQLQNNFVRVFGSGNPNPSSLLNNSAWYIGQGDGNRFSNGNVGQWGIQFAHRFINEIQVPVAIFNGAHPAQPISFFQAPVNYTSSLGTNYGRLYYRITNAQLKNHIRAAFWSQGEKNGLPGFAMEPEEYQQSFEDLKDSWQIDYPNIEHYYLFQTANGCDKPLMHLMKVKEAQRQLALNDVLITTLPTASLPRYSDGCHYDFTDGYEVFGNRLYEQVRADIYGLPATNDLSIPNPVSAVYLGNDIIEIETHSPGLWLDGADSEIVLREEDNSIIEIQFDDSKILLHLEHAPSADAVVSYLGPQSAASSGFIRNANNIELLSFYNLPVQIGELDVESINQNAMNIYPNPVRDELHINDTESITSFQIVDFSGKQLLFADKIDSNTIHVGHLESGMYHLLIKHKDGAITTHSIIRE